MLTIPARSIKQNRMPGDTAARFCFNLIVKGGNIFLWDIHHRSAFFTDHMVMRFQRSVKVVRSVWNGYPYKQTAFRQMI